jgi:hypothetical protein
MGLLTAIVFFGALTAILTALRTTGDSNVGLAEPKRVPDPGARDIHTVDGTLGRAYVPSWG